MRSRALRYGSAAAFGGQVVICRFWQFADRRKVAAARVASMMCTEPAMRRRWQAPCTALAEAAL
eukprot:NODE_33508_length_290_cov_5.944785.p5 GENE.NODE_33508_length_290_cov_5.944785~~NODE_33508_length_290_cov_5.944785.p5  ORF type:complete len:64 (-),score=11.47 NODE_33508_length_290_cov_5.944785:27-218(-)